MSATSVGIPIRILHECIGHSVSIDLKNGMTVRGRVEEVEDSMGVRLSAAEIRGGPNGTRAAAALYVRGALIRFIVLPNVLEAAPLLTRHKMQVPQDAGTSSKRGAGRGGRGRKRQR
eukprot:CAMPEP_0170755942 /NCGR_PEP_ID=MMETSP0437-20130122/13774_1 /TAXON_ID=0 /ORGANISM="Sexangularia sp." /LENGTH=116 /DNA_ID=CAMNT_0011095119 /DNA_START=30 /DNA_END=380 /DNA_ORIENTATION=+